MVTFATKTPLVANASCTQPPIANNITFIFYCMTSSIVVWLWYIVVVVASVVQLFWYLGLVFILEWIQQQFTSSL